jgi:FkbM family methyltransferase
MNLIQTQDKGFGSFIVVENDLIGRFINHYGFWEAHLWAIYSKLILPDDIILDAGANIGFHAVQFAKLGKKVYAYDPQPLVFNLLCANILFNEVTDKIEQYRLGLSDTPGTIKMQPLSQFDEKNGCHNFGGRGLTKEDDGEEVVELVTFDKDVDVIKIDIQGSEIYAFRGMEQMLDRCEPWIMFENYEGQENDELVLDFLLNKGYTVYRSMIGNKEDCYAFKNIDKHQKVKETLQNVTEYTFKIHEK